MCVSPNRDVSVVVDVVVVVVVVNGDVVGDDEAPMRQRREHDVARPT
jgi:hypothetical protein